MPDTGDIVWLTLEPKSGHEQGGHRPVLVLTPANYNKPSGLMVCCPMTTKIKGYPFEVVTTIDGKENAILADQVKSLDWQARNARKKGTATTKQLAAVKSMVKALLAIE